MKSGNLNFREPSGPLQACNGTALPLPPHYAVFSRLRLVPLPEVYILSPAGILEKHPAILTAVKSLQNTLRGVQCYQHVNRNPQPQDPILKNTCPSNRFEHINFNIILQWFHYIPPLNILLYLVHVNYTHKNHLLPHREHLAPITKTEL
jgi:hypothetical protein